jgi:hypothetical protein
LDRVREIDTGKQVRDRPAHALGDRLFQLLSRNSTGIPEALNPGRSD